MSSCLGRSWLKAIQYQGINASLHIEVFHSIVLVRPALGNRKDSASCHVSDRDIGVRDMSDTICVDSETLRNTACDVRDKLAGSCTVLRKKSVLQQEIPVHTGHTPSARQPTSGQLRVPVHGLLLRPSTCTDSPRGCSKQNPRAWCASCFFLVRVQVTLHSDPALQCREHALRNRATTHVKKTHSLCTL